VISANGIEEGEYEMARRQPTLDTVAAEAGVSRATVSRVINGLAAGVAGGQGCGRPHDRRLGYVPNLPRGAW